MTKRQNQHCGCDIKVSSARERRILIIVLLINAGMFFAEFAAGILSNSTALLADSLDMLADAFVYAIGLYALGRPTHWRVRAALSSGILQLLLGAGVFIEATHKIFVETLPDAGTMGVFGVLALIANTVSFILLARYRDGDINLRATWVCSRNDMLANIGILIASGLVLYFHSPWPDIVIGSLIAVVIIHSAWVIIKEARSSLNSDHSF